MSETVLKQEERIAFALRSLYLRYGYLPYKMSKFEAYDLYVENKDFLIGDGIITFNDTDGKLLALKPDVTLSILKNAGNDGAKQKVYYNENVYRISGETKQFKEIMQTGIECIGQISLYDIYETLYLAVASLQKISEEYVLDISHLGILSAILEDLGAGETFNRKLMRLIAEKNVHETQALCLRYGISEENTKKVCTIIRAYGSIPAVIQTLTPLCRSEKAKGALDELTALYALFQDTPYADKLRLDFSVVNDMQYYNGIVFKGFVGGVCEGVLSGGQYDRLSARMGRNSGAIGFAVYLDLLQNIRREKTQFDVDVIVLTDEHSCLQTVAKTVRTLVTGGESVRVENSVGTLRAKRIVNLTGGAK